MDSEITLIPSNDNSQQQIDSSIQQFNEPLGEFLLHLNLPTANVLMPTIESAKVIQNLEQTLAILPINQRSQAYYLSKFTVAVAVGLFDGALNFLWDETIKSLRQLVQNFDLQYFFSIAETISSRYRGLRSFEELEAVQDHDLLEICKRIGLLADINYQRLTHINYLRNHASAAHPNDNEVTGLELLAHLETCLKHVITATPDHSVIQLRQLFANLRKNVVLSPSDITAIGLDLERQPTERIDDFIQSIFGLYCDPTQTTECKENVGNLSPFLWRLSSNTAKYAIGAKYGYYRKNGDSQRKEAAELFLTKVNGLAFKDEDSLSVELIEKLQDLNSAHNSWNNFYNEYPHAKSIASSLPATGIPEGARALFVKVVCTCHIGNGKGNMGGVDLRADAYYVRFFDHFKEEEVKIFIHLFFDNEFTSLLYLESPDRRARELARTLLSKVSNNPIRHALNKVIGASRRGLRELKNDDEFKNRVSFIR